MNLRQHFSRLALFGIVCAFLLPVSGAPPDERDRQVLETLLLHLVTDSKFDMTRVPTNGATIVLLSGTPKGTGFLLSHQIQSEVDGHELPSDAETDLRQRNTPDPAKPDTHDSVSAFYTNLTFSADIVVTNLTGTRLRSYSFHEAYPKSRGWLESYLPGYSKDGTLAIVRAGVGPWAHAAMLTAVLEKRGNKWAVAWYHVARFV